MAGANSLFEQMKAGWEDGLMYDANNPFNRTQFDNERVIANAWDNIWEWGVADRAHRLANAGYQVVLPRDAMVDGEIALLEESRALLPLLPFTDIDLLIIDVRGNQVGQSHREQNRLLQLTPQHAVQYQNSGLCFRPHAGLNVTCGGDWKEGLLAVHPLALRPL